MSKKNQPKPKLPSRIHCLIDTSILLLMLEVPRMGHDEDYEEIKKAFSEKIANGEIFYLPMATIIETGNHIHQCPDEVGDNRHDCATKFADFIRKTYNEETPFGFIEFLKPDILLTWIDEYKTRVHELGMGDLSIIKDWDSFRNDEDKKNDGLYIWTLDKDFDENDEKLSRAAKKLLKSKKHFESYKHNL